MYLRKITQFTTSSSAKLLFTSSSTTSALLLNNNIYKTKMMSTMTTTQTNFSSRRGAIFSLKQQQQHKKKSFSLTTRAMGAKVGDQISGVLQVGPWIDGMPTPVNMAERCKGKKVILVGLPGAFTPTWSTCQVPGYIAGQDKLKGAGIDEVIIFCTNDTQVMDAWGEAQGIAGTNITFMGDPNSVMVENLGVELTHPGPCSKLGPGRSKRFAMYIDDGVIKTFNVAESPTDPAGDDFPEVACIDNMVDTMC